MSTKARVIEIHFNNEGNIGAITNPDGVQYDPVIGKTLLFREVLPDDELTELRRQNEIMKEALEFYNNGDAFFWYDKLGKIHRAEENGKRAREALAKCGKGGNV